MNTEKGIRICALVTTLVTWALALLCFSLMWDLGLHGSGRMILGLSSLGLLLALCGVINLMHGFGCKFGQ
jgi:hypothetical protein